MDTTTEARIQLNVGVTGTDKLRDVEGALKKVESAGKTTESSVKKLDTATNSLASSNSKSAMSLDGLVKRYLSLTTIVATTIALVKKAVDLTVAFDDSMDKLAFQSGKTGAAFQQVSQRLSEFTAQVADKTKFTMAEVADSMGKLRDRGFDVYTMTKDQLQPILAAAAVTGQDLAEVADSAGAALQAFGLGMDDLARIADMQAVAFRESGMSAQEFASSIEAAGAVAKASGTSLESYMAVVTRLTQLGQNADQFQKLFFSTLQAPSAQQLRALTRNGIDPYLGGSALAQSNAISRGISGAASFGSSLMGRMGLGAFSSPLDTIAGHATGQAARTGAAMAGANRAKLLQADLIALADQLDVLSARGESYSRVLDRTNLRTADLTQRNHGLKASLAGLNDQVGTTKERMGVLQGQLQGMLNPNLEGLEATDAYKDGVERLTDQLAVHGRALDLTKQKYQTLSDSLAKAQGRVQALQSKMQDLRSAELVGEKGFNDQEFGLQQQIAALQLQKSQLAPFQMFEGNALDRQIAQLQNQLTQSQLQRTLTIDPERKRIEDAMRAVEGVTPRSADDILGEIGQTDAQLTRADRRARRAERRQKRAGRAVEGEEATIAALTTQMQTQQDALDAAMKRNEEQLEAVRTQAHKTMQALGLEDGPMTKEELFSTMGKIQSEYGSLKTRLSVLTTAQDKQEAALARNEQQLDLTKLAGDRYKQAISGIQDEASKLKEVLAGKEEEFGGIAKVLVDQQGFLKQVQDSGNAVGLAYEMFGKRAGGAMIALLGEKGDGIEKIGTLADKYTELGVAIQGSADAMGDLIGQGQVAAAELANKAIRAGSDMNDVNTYYDVNGKAHSSLNYMSPGDALDWTPLFEKAWATWKRGYGLSTGGLVPGSGLTDTVPAMLTPGEEVLRRDDPRHRANGGSGITVNVYNPSVRNDQDIQRLASAISRELAAETRRARAGMPA